VIRVVLVDDQELVRAGLRGILRPRLGFEIVGECGDGGAASALVRSSNPDVVLMDVRMPVLDGVGATLLLRANQPMTPVLALTTFDDDEALAGMLRAGAAGFILKGVPAEELQRAVRAVAEGGAWLDPTVTSRVLALYRAAPPHSAGDPAALDVLTARERQVLTLLAQGRTNAEIARDLGVGEGTVKTHINHVFSKLDLRDRPAAMIFAFDHNLSAAPNRRSQAERPRLQFQDPIVVE
jgi:DNA-binding NarL/FixJ family response regulator